VFAFIPIYFSRNAVGDPGPFFTIYAVAMSAMRLFAGKASDKHGRVAVFVPSVLVMAVASLYLATTPDYWGMLAGGVFIGGGLGAAYPALMSLAIDRAPLADRGSAMATIGAAFDGGLTLGTLVDGYLLDWGGFPAMFATNALMPVIGVIGFLLLDRRGRQRGDLAGTGAVG
jgi:MFS family permease